MSNFLGPQFHKEGGSYGRGGMTWGLLADEAVCTLEEAVVDWLIHQWVNFEVATDGQGVVFRCWFA